MADTIPTRLLIISDTHGEDFDSNTRPQQRADVVLHCGDLTDGSKLEEFHTALNMLRSIDAPLKLIIPGNHDFTMDRDAFTTKVAEAKQPLNPELVAQEYGRVGQAQQLFDDSKDEGIVFLHEGTHQFTLNNGAMLTIYASPYTPALGAWGFQYHPNHGRRFDIQGGTDIVMTHGPPKGIMDFTSSRERAGCTDLFAAVAQARPRVHCFGHIHEGWGAKLVTWKDSGINEPSRFTSIDNNNSSVIENLNTLKKIKFDSNDIVEEKQAKVEQLRQHRCASTSHCAQDEYPLVAGSQTLFVNAAIMGDGDVVQRPWLVDIELPKQGGNVGD
ncbi:hypothetical protein PV10_08895 [Exophiala mesophila]|uniref:Calcineurin-like phosphoesterase domain-containing protein n=1 Tax=Exophiala mesophila TaxID=212818 RepID=A0A0D1ZRA4_EXOME|nr:uncharacterized protein PV10_08895 [Exophiala mesophila]KIV89318.1 hypothetical protein PV10_08895 [Exophiala mesophila]